MKQFIFATIYALSLLEQADFQCIIKTGPMLHSCPAMQNFVYTYVL